MNDNEYSSYLDGISYILDKFDSIIVDNIVEKFRQAIDKGATALKEKNMDGLDGYYYSLGEQHAYDEMCIIIKKFTKDLKEQRCVGFR
ncbi:MAG: hypothetical protein LIR46_12885 [Bacteroidota bacterium]|nr:hypothetical protein [Bacteroidota bacterium]